ncbi:MAG TPA: NACHT domain-containing protein, partial [Rugosimonospora sp.]|nr:NACHT domain-containing protein [Rugosimonospora sp.]
MTTGLESAASRTVSLAAAHVFTRLRHASARARIEEEQRPPVPEEVGRQLVERLPPEHLDALHRYVSSADFELVAYQVMMVRALAALGGEHDALLADSREALRQGLRHFTELAPDELTVATDALFDLLRAAALAVAQEVRPGDLSGRDLAPLSQLATAAARNTALLGRVADLYEFQQFADDLRREVVHLHGVLRLPHTGLNRAVPYVELYVPARLRGLPEPADPYDLVDSDLRTVVLGGAGAGKSTLMAKLAHDAAATSARAPFLVPLRDYVDMFEHSNATLLDILRARCRSPYNLDPSADTVEYLLLNGRAAVILDGIDEIIDVAVRRRVADSIEAFAVRYPAVPVVVTARMVGYGEAPLDPRVFRVVTVEHFDDERVGRYAEQWFGLDETLVPAERKARCDAFLRDSAVVPDLRRVPLMLSLLCALYSMENHDFPRDRPQVYESCALMLFQKWDAIRGVRGVPRFTAQFRGALQLLAWRMYRAADESPYLPRRKILSEITAYLHSRRFESYDEARDVAEQFLKFCTERAWVLVEVGANRGEPLYGFAHPSFLEYFAAECIVRTSRDAREVYEKIWQYLTSVDADELCELAVLMLDRKDADGGDEVLQLALDDADLRKPYRRAATRSFAARSLSYATPSPQVLRRIVTGALDTTAEVPPAGRLASVTAGPAREQLATADRPLRELLHRCSVDNESLVTKYLVQWFEAALATGDEGAAFTLLNIEQFAPAARPLLDALFELRTGAAARLDALAQADLACAISRSRHEPLWLERVVELFGPAGLYLRTAVGRSVLPAPAEVLMAGALALGG